MANKKTQKKRRLKEQKRVEYLALLKLAEESEEVLEDSEKTESDNRFEG